MSQLNDISLVAQVVVFRNTRAFDQLVGKYQSSVRRFFLHLTCGDSELSDDLAQDTFIKAYTNLASFVYADETESEKSDRKDETDSG